MSESETKKAEEKDKGASAEGMEGIWKVWQSAWKQGFEQWQKLWEQAGAQYPGAEFFTSWINLLQKQFQEYMGKEPKEFAGLGPEVFSRLLNAGAIYARFLEFWKTGLAPLLSAPEGKLDAEKFKELSQQWIDQYQEILKTLWGAPPDRASQAVLESWAKMAKAQMEAYWNFLKPVFTNFENFPDKIQGVMSGDTQKTLEFYGLFRDTYEQTLGKIIRMPSMGYFKDIQERTSKAIDSYLEYRVALNEYYSLFYQTSVRAMERVLARLEEFKDEDWSSPEGIKKFYRLWWTINEDTYQELFLSPEFIHLLKEVLSRGLLFKKWLDEIYDKLVEATPLPSKKDMDEVYKAIYDLKKEVRWQRRAIEQLKKVKDIEDGGE